MKSFSLAKAPSAQNAVVLIGQTTSETLANIVELAGGGSPPSYETSRVLAPTLMEKNDLQWCLRQCSGITWDLQRQINEELLATLSGYRSLINPRWYRRPAKTHYEGHGVSIALQPMGVWSDGDTLFVDWLQPWKYKEMSRRHRDILFTLLKHRFLIGDYFEARFRFVNLMATPETRERAVWIEQHESFTELSDEELGSELIKLAEALNEFSELPKEPRKPRSKPDDKRRELPFGTD
jgi:hypothetical protein